MAKALIPSSILNKLQLLKFSVQLTVLPTLDFDIFVTICMRILEAIFPNINHNWDILAVHFFLLLLLPQEHDGPDPISGYC
jgi:hypothetical protein